VTVQTIQATLDRLPLHRAGVIVRIGGERLVRQRLLTMGLVPGETVTVTGVAPLGDPLELQIKGYRLSLRVQEARQIMVEFADETTL
jgi:ferrous iron transport protein A